MKKEKLFMDPVHGYISVPVDYCEQFVDTFIFQRLRYIAQTSTICHVFPSARHDRFIHSLGVFHLGRKLYQALLDNTKDDDEISTILKDDKLKNSFLVACLMHDCGHSPFSHIFEKYYNENPCNKTEKQKHKKGHADFNKCFDNKIPLENGLSQFPSDHEIMSAAVLKTHFSDKKIEGDWDCELSARMILGRRYPEVTSTEDSIKIKNVLIDLLNGYPCDVDKLDYIIRDSWTSGVKSGAIDISRLLYSATLVRNKKDIQFAYKKSAISVIHAVIDARNYIYKWVTRHHTAVYYSIILDEALKELWGKLGNVLEKMFSLEAFKCPVSVQKKIKNLSVNNHDLV